MLTKHVVIITHNNRITQQNKHDKRDKPFIATTCRLLYTVLNNTGVCFDRYQAEQTLDEPPGEPNVIFSANTSPYISRFILNTVKLL